jgi:hypothetical protein
VQFWQRWHISLSTWLRDYLYISLGGKYNRIRNVMITMLLSGLWHGAAWTFVARGGFSRLDHHLHPSVVQQCGPGWFRPKPAVFQPLIEVADDLLSDSHWLGVVPGHRMDSAGDILLQMHGLAGDLPSFGSKALIIFALTVAALLFMHLIDYVVLNKTRQWMARW